MPVQDPTRALKIAGAAPQRSSRRVVASGRAVREDARATMRVEADAALGATDARWVLAVRARESLEGGAAAVLRPEKRRMLNDLGRRLGLRAFDVSLVLAIVQDEARRGVASSAELAARLRMVPGTDAVVARADGETETAWWAGWLAAALVLAGVLTAAGMMWVGG